MSIRLFVAALAAMGSGVPPMPGGRATGWELPQRRWEETPAGPMTRHCPRCGAVPGAACRRDGLARRHRFHKGRMDK